MCSEFGLKAGDVVRIGDSAAEQVVIYAQSEFAYESTGHSFYVDQFEVIPLEFSPLADLLSMDQAIVNPKSKKYWITDAGGLVGIGTGVSINDVKVIGAVKLEQEISVTYRIKNLG